MNDYLVDLLKNYKCYMAKIEFLKAGKNIAKFNPIELNKLKSIEKDLEYLKIVISHLKNENQELIEYLYFKGYSMREYGQMKTISKSGINNRKRSALLELDKFFQSVA